MWQRFRKRPLAYLSTLIAPAGLIVAYLAWLQPQWKEQARKDLTQQIDNEIEAKLKEHKFDELVGDVKTPRRSGTRSPSGDRRGIATQGNGQADLAAD